MSKTLRWLIVAVLVALSFAATLAHDFPSAIWVMLLALVIKP